MSDLFGNHIVGFPTRWLISYCTIGGFYSIPESRGGHSLVSSVPMRDQRIVEHTLNSVIDI